MINNSIHNELKSTLARLGFNTNNIESETSFINDLGLESLEFIELILSIEEVYSITINSSYESINTIGGLVITIENILKEQEE